MELFSENYLRDLIIKIRGYTKPELRGVYQDVRQLIETLRQNFKSSAFPQTNNGLKEFLKASAKTTTRDIGLYIVLQFILVNKPMEMYVRKNGSLVPYIFEEEVDASDPAPLGGGCSLM